MTAKKHYKAVIFDLDGTLLNTSRGVFSSVLYMAEKMGFEAPEPECSGPLSDRRSASPSSVSGMSETKKRPERTSTSRSIYRRESMNVDHYPG